MNIEILGARSSLSRHPDLMQYDHMQKNALEPNNQETEASFIPVCNMSLTAISIYRQIFKIWRARRFELFKASISPKLDETMIDVGGHPWSWTPYPPLVASIDVVDIRKSAYIPADHPHHHIRVTVGDGRKLVAADRAYHIAFSNSVIEHVGTWEEQQQFAKELRRVGKKLWCQTPAWECPIEPHYMAPFIHWLPRSIQRRIIRPLTPWGWLSKPPPQDIEFMVNTTRLITRREMNELFPDCRILVERMLWIIPKSYIAVRDD